MKKTVFGLLPVLCAILLLFSFNLAADTLTRKYGAHLDMTEEQLYDLSDTTKQVLSSLGAPVQITVFSSETDFVTLVRETLSRYVALSNGKIQLTYTDPYLHPSAVREYQNEGFTVTEGTIAVKGSGYRTVIQLKDLFLSDDDGNLTGLQIEQPLTSAVLHAGNGTQRRAQFIEGHDESYSDGFSSLLSQNCFTVGRLPLSVSNPDADLLIIASPAADYSADEIAKLDAFMNRGGKLMVFLSPSSSPLANLCSFLSEWGIEPTDTVVGEHLQYVDDNPLSIVPVYASHEINSRFSSMRIYPVLTDTLALNILYTKNGSTVTSKVLYSTDQAYAYSGTAAAAPYVLAAAAERKQGDSSSRLFVCGSRGLYADSLLTNSAYANSLLLAQAVSWCTMQDETIGIPAKMISGTPISVTAGHLILFATVMIAGLPLLILGFGLVLYLRRRHL